MAAWLARIAFWFFTLVAWLDRMFFDSTELWHPPYFLVLLGFFPKQSITWRSARLASKLCRAELGPDGSLRLHSGQAPTRPHTAGGGILPGLWPHIGWEGPVGLSSRFVAAASGFSPR